MEEVHKSMEINEINSIGFFKKQGIMRQMKNLKIFAVAVFIFVAVSSMSQIVRAQSADSSASFETTKAWSKLGDTLQSAWLDAKKSGDMSRRLDCFVRVRAPADNGDQSFLFSNGFVVRQFAGPVASGYMTADDVPDVANLPFVVSIKLAK